MPTQKQQKVGRQPSKNKGTSSSRKSVAPKSGARSGRERDVRKNTDFYRIELIPRSEFVKFRTHDGGEGGRLQRIAGQRTNGKWETAAWLVLKENAHIEGKALIIDVPRIKAVLKKKAGNNYMRIQGDVFKSDRADRDRSSITSTQRNARRENIKKAQAARWK